MQIKLLGSIIIGLSCSFGLGILWSVYSWLSLLGLILTCGVLYYFLTKFCGDLEKAQEVVKAISEGDLSQKVEFTGQLEIMQDFERMVDNLRNLVSKIMKLSVILSSVSKKWTNSVNDLNTIMDQHVTSVENLANGNEDIVKSVDEAVTVLQQIRENYVTQGQKTVDIQEEKMNHNLKAVTELKTEISSLDQQAEDVTLITETINNIAQETNLLSLNAAIEAARAQENGRGFNIVAEEIGELATDSINSSKEVMEIVDEVQTGIKGVVETVEETKVGIEKQQDTVEEVSDLFDNIVDTTQKIQSDLEQINELTQESFSKTEELNAGFQEQAGHIQYIADQADRLSDLAFDLQSELDKFDFVKLAYTFVEEAGPGAMVAKEIIERTLGINVVLVQLNYEEIYQSVAQGVLDGMVSGWLPQTHKNYMEEFRGKLKNLGVNLEGAQTGLAVPEYMEIESIPDLKSDVGVSQTRIHALRETAGVTINAQKSLDVYRLDEWQVDTIGADNVMSNLRQAIKRKEPIVVTAWQPHWMFEEFPLKFLRDPKQVFGAAENIHTIVRKDLKEDNHEVYEILNELYFEMEELTGMMYEIEQGGKPEEVAADFVERNINRMV